MLNILKLLDGLGHDRVVGCTAMDCRTQTSVAKIGIVSVLRYGDNFLPEGISKFIYANSNPKITIMQFPTAITAC